MNCILQILILLALFGTAAMITCVTIWRLSELKKDEKNEEGKQEDE